MFKQKYLMFLSLILLNFGLTGCASDPVEREYYDEKHKYLEECRKYHASIPELPPANDVYSANRDKQIRFNVRCTGRSIASPHDPVSPEEAKLNAQPQYCTPPKKSERLVYLETMWGYPEVYCNAFGALPGE